MDRKPTTLLILCVIAVCVVVWGLYLNSSLSHEIYRGSFERTFPSDSVMTDMRVLGLHYNSYYVAGSGRDRVYLGNWTAPFNMIVVNTSSLDIQHVRLQGTVLDSLKNHNGFKLVVDSPYFFLLNGSLPALARGKLASATLDELLPVEYFQDATPIARSSFILRSYSLRNNRFELARAQSDSPHFQFKYGLLDSYGEGVLSVQGMLHYGKTTAKAVYLYSYRNEYIVMDSSLHLLYKGTTLDSFSHAPIKVEYIKSEGRSMLASPPTVVNSQSRVWGSYLFVKSNVMAHNEVTDDFVNGAVFDVYDLSDGTYCYSFHVKNHQHEILTSFAILPGHFAGIYGRNLVLYTFRSPELTIAKNKYGHVWSADPSK